MSGVHNLAYMDLQDFMADLDKKGLLKRIMTEVDPVLEVTEVADRIVKQGGPALYFENIKGSSYPLVTNLFGSMDRMALALGVENLDHLGERIQEYLSLFQGSFGSFREKIRTLPKAAQAFSFFPKTVMSAPCQEMVEDRPNLGVLPILQCWPEDGGKFITLPLVFTKDAKTGRRNCGVYRMQVFDGQTTGMHWHLNKDGAQHLSSHMKKKDRMEAAVALGADPAVIYAATAPLPRDIDEMILAGFLRKSAVEMVKCRTVGLEVPAHAEFILEGYIDPAESRKEGPFGDHTGYYSLADDYPVFHLTCLTRKKKPVYPAVIVGRPIMEDFFLGKATERLFLPLLKMLVPEISDLNMPPEGVFHNCVVVSIRKEYPGQAKKVMNALWGLNQMAFTKMIIVVDQDVNIQDMSMVWWRVFNSIDAKRDLVIMEGPLDALDHSSPLAHYGSKLGIDATKKWPGEGHARRWPDYLTMSPDVRELVTRRWSEYGFTDI